MKPTLLLLLATLSSLPLRSQTAFEGSVESKNSTTDELGETQHYTMTLRVKGDMVRTEISAFGSNPASVLIHRRDLGVVWVLDESRQTFFEMRIEREASVGEGTNGDGSSHTKRTGKTKKILGYPCEQLIFRNGDVQTEYWGTKKLTALASAIARVFGGDEQGGGVRAELASLGYFPMIARTKLEGKVVEYSEVTKITRGAVDEKLFTVPVTYHKESAPEMP